MSPSAVKATAWVYSPVLAVTSLTKSLQVSTVSAKDEPREPSSHAYMLKTCTLWNDEPRGQILLDRDRKSTWDLLTYLFGLLRQRHHPILWHYSRSWLCFLCKSCYYLQHPWGWFSKKKKKWEPQTFFERREENDWDHRHEHTSLYPFNVTVSWYWPSARMKVCSPVLPFNFSKAALKLYHIQDWNEFNFLSIWFSICELLFRYSRIFSGLDIYNVVLNGIALLGKSTRLPRHGQEDKSDKQIRRKWFDIHSPIDSVDQWNNGPLETD